MEVTKTQDLSPAIPNCFICFDEQRLMAIIEYIAMRLFARCRHLSTLRPVYSSLFNDVILSGDSFADTMSYINIELNMLAYRCLHGLGACSL